MFSLIFFLVVSAVVSGGTQCDAFLMSVSMSTRASSAPRTKLDPSMIQHARNENVEETFEFVANTKKPMRSIVVSYNFPSTNIITYGVLYWFLFGGYNSSGGLFRSKREMLEDQIFQTKCAQLEGTRKGSVRWKELEIMIQERQLKLVKMKHGIWPSGPIPTTRQEQKDMERQIKSTIERLYKEIEMTRKSGILVLKGAVVLLVLVVARSIWADGI